MLNMIRKMLIFAAITPICLLANVCTTNDSDQLPSLTLGCPAGQTVMQGENGPYCINNYGKCLTAVMLNPECPEQNPAQESYHQDQCQTCGYYPISQCPDTCGSDQQPTMKNNVVQFCVDSENNCLTVINYRSGFASEQEPYNEGVCSMCGMYPTSHCPGTCTDGQTPVLDDGLILFCVNSKKQCLEKLSYHATPGTIQNTYREGQCQACGLYPIFNCPKGCAEGQKTMMQDNKPEFCIDEKTHTCLTVIDYSTGIPSKQESYQDGLCSTCGLYPATQCPDVCPDGQTPVKVDGKTQFCTDDRNQCLTPINYTSGIASEQKPYHQDDCAECGLYPISKCPVGCAHGQNAIKSNGEVKFCTDDKSQCLTPISYTNGQPSTQMPYTKNECSACGLYPTTACPSICAEGQKPVKIDGKIAFCTDINDKCWEPINYTQDKASTAVAYYKGDCKVCGIYPISKCPNNCADDQQPVLKNGDVAFCVDNMQQCFTAIDYSSGSASKQTSYKDGDCATCGQYPTSSCPVFCKPGQREAIVNDGIVFCVNSEYECLTPVSYNNDGSKNHQESYTEGCCSSGYYGGADDFGQFSCPPLA